MTPIKYLLGVGLGLFSVEHADHRHQLGSATSPQTARWILESLSMAHNVPAYLQADDTATREDVSWTPSEG